VPAPFLAFLEAGDPPSSMEQLLRRAKEWKERSHRSWVCSANLVLMSRSFPEAENSLARGFRDVDAANARKMAFCLEYLDSLPSVREYKAEALRLMDLHPGSSVADLGCGLGADVRRMAQRVGPEGVAVGVDFSNVLLKSARSASGSFSNAKFLQADIRQLPFADAALDCCKVDRVLQHVKGPQEVLCEIFRALKPGGRVVCIEPDWGTFLIEHGDPTVAAQVGQNWAESFQNPGIGAELGDLLAKTGFVQVRVQPHTLLTEDFESSDFVFDVAQSARGLAASTANRCFLEWLNADTLPKSQMRCSVELMINCAQKP
jgi:SAM-dependent methyltransferase